MVEGQNPSWRARSLSELINVNMGMHGIQALNVGATPAQSYISTFPYSHIFSITFWPTLRSTAKTGQEFSAAGINNSNANAKSYS